MTLYFVHQGEWKAVSEQEISFQIRVQQTHFLEMGTMKEFEACITNIARTLVWNSLHNIRCKLEWELNHEIECVDRVRGESHLLH